MVKDEDGTVPAPAARRRARAGLASAAAAAFLLAGCADFGHAELTRDQLGYSQALTESQKEQALLNIVRLRYGSVPVFLNATQVIAGYQLQRNASIGSQIFPSAALGTFASGNAAVQLQQSPTFTFQPVNGKDYAESYMRPLSPVGLYPLTTGNLPVDVLLRLTVDSIGPLHNVNVFSGATDGSSPKFFKLLADLRSLQLAGALDIRLSGGQTAKISLSTVVGDRLVVVFRPSRVKLDVQLQREVRQLLGLPQDIAEAEIVYGSVTSAPSEIPIVTRSILGILTAVAFDVEVPETDVDAGLTIPSITRKEDGRRPEILIRASPEHPLDAFVTIPYRDKWFSISDTDFDSKVAFGVLELLISLAQTPQASGAVVTVPAR